SYVVQDTETWSVQAVYLDNTVPTDEYLATFYVKYQMEVDACDYYGITRYFRFHFKNTGAVTVTVEVFGQDSGETENFYVLSYDQEVYLNLHGADHVVPVDIDELWGIEVTVYESYEGTGADFVFSDFSVNWGCGDYSRLFTMRYEGSEFIPTSGEEDFVCDSIIGESEEAQDEYGFDYTGIVFGSTFCINVGPYEYEILGVSIDIPWIAYICVQELSLGVATVFGVDISFDAFTVVMAVAWAIRSLFIS
ncbi:MAG: hypothetical protein K8R53_06165, partial [Bacteroidales bacterium]|nr:hypothetical protein [Bacteroidales bacterium]